jgi:ActR/RegA family two-component response regulator
MGFAAPSRPAGGEIDRRAPSLSLDGSPSPAVLVIEDDDAVAGYLSDNLAADGFRTSRARGAAEGLRALEVRRPDLLVLDLALADARASSCSIASARPTAWRRASSPLCPC